MLCPQIQGAHFSIAPAALVLREYIRIGFARNAVFFVGPGAKVNQLAAFAAKWPERIVTAPLYRLVTVGTGQGGGLGHLWLLARLRYLSCNRATCCSSSVMLPLLSMMSSAQASLCSLPSWACMMAVTCSALTLSRARVRSICSSGARSMTSTRWTR